MSVVSVTLVLGWISFSYYLAKYHVNQVESHCNDGGLEVLYEWRIRLWLLLLLNCLISLIITIAYHEPSNTTAGYLFRLFKLSNGADSWWPMSQAIEHLRNNPDIPVYTEIFFNSHTKFQYPLSSLLYIDAFQRLTGLPWIFVFKILNVISLICIPLVGVASYFLLVNTIDSRKAPNLSIRDPVLLVACLLITVFFYPLIRSYTLGQIQTWITLLVAGSLLAWQTNHKNLSGLLLGICCTIKPQWIVVVFWGGLRRQWGFSASCAGTFLLISVLSLALYGSQNMADYFPVLSYISQHGESYFGNQSINGLVNRLLFNGNNLNWDEQNFPAYVPTVYLLTILSGVMIIGTALIWRVKKSPTEMDLALIILSLTIASPIAWKHHYGVLLPILALAAPIIWSMRQRAKLIPLLLIGYILVSQQLDTFVISTAASYWNFVESYLFWGGLNILLLLYTITRVISKPYCDATPSLWMRFAATGSSYEL